MRETKRAYGWPEDAQFLVPDGVKEHFAEGVGAVEPSCAAAWEERLGELAGREPGAAAEIDAMQRRGLPEGWDAEIPSFEPDEKGIATRKASNSVQNAIAARLPWLLAGSADLTDSTSVRLDLDGRRGLRARRLRRPPAPLRDPRARVGGGLQRALALQAAAAVVDLPDLLRLRAARDPALGADGAAGHPYLHPRLDRPRRGRPHPPAGRAARLAAGDPRPRRDPPRRRQRGGRGLAGGARPHPPACRAGPHPPERARLRPRALRLGRGPAPGRLRARRRRRWRAGCDPDRHRQRGRAGDRRARGAERRRGRAHAWSACPAGSSSTARTPPTATRSCRRR